MVYTTFMTSPLYTPGLASLGVADGVVGMGSDMGVPRIGDRTDGGRELESGVEEPAQGGGVVPPDDHAVGLGLIAEVGCEPLRHVFGQGSGLEPGDQVAAHARVRTVLV